MVLLSWSLLDLENFEAVSRCKADLASAMAREWERAEGIDSIYSFKIPFSLQSALPLLLLLKRCEIVFCHRGCFRCLTARHCGCLFKSSRCFSLLDFGYNIETGLRLSSQNLHRATCRSTAIYVPTLASSRGDLSAEVGNPHANLDSHNNSRTLLAWLSHRQYLGLQYVNATTLNSRVGGLASLCAKRSCLQECARTRTITIMSSTR